MKKVISVVLLVAIVCSLCCACGSGNDELKEKLIGTWTVKQGNYDYYEITFNDDGTATYIELEGDTWVRTGATWKIKGGKVIFTDTGDRETTFSDFNGITMTGHNWKNDMTKYEKNS